MPVLLEGNYIGDIVKRELDLDLSRKRVVLKSGFAVLGLGYVMGIITASGKWAPYNPTLADGTQNAAGILLIGGDTAAADIPGIVIRSLGVISTAKLVWGAGVTTLPHKAAAYAALEANHLIAVDPN